MEDWLKCQISLLVKYLQKTKNTNMHHRVEPFVCIAQYKTTYKASYKVIRASNNIRSYTLLSSFKIPQWAVVSTSYSFSLDACEARVWCLSVASSKPKSKAPVVSLSKKFNTRATDLSLIYLSRSEWY